MWPYKLMVETAKKWRLPSLGEFIWKNLDTDKWFASNLTYIYENFSNNLHKDFDENDFTFGIWMPVFAEGIIRMVICAIMLISVFQTSN